jgi:hypothetical protein
MMMRRSMTRGVRGALTVALGLLTAVIARRHVSAAGDDPYPMMAPVSHYLIASRAEEIGLAKSAAPASIADHANVLALGAHGYETAVKGTNGFVCIVGRSWDVGFADPQFWNPKIRAPECFNATSARSVLPRYLTRTERVLAGASKSEMQKREAADRAAGTLKAPEPGAMCYMLSKGGYLNDAAAGPWHPHVMYFAPRTDDAEWGANFPGSPVASDSASYDETTIFFVVVPNWSDDTPAPLHKPASGQ